MNRDVPGVSTVLLAIALVPVSIALLMIAFRELPVLGPIVGMPDPFFEAGCSAGEAVGTRMFCFGFVWNALTTGIFIGVVGPIIGTYLVHREMALIGETLAHTAFAGVAFGTLFVAGTGWTSSLLLAALAAAVVGALGVQYLSAKTGSYGDVPVAIMLTGSFAVGTLFIDIGGGFSFVDIESFLFGGIAVVPDENVAAMGVLSLAVIAVVALTYKPLLFITFDEEAARVARFNVSGYNAMLVFLTALVVVGSMQILGVILVAAMLVVPVAAASQLTVSFRQTLFGGIVVGEVSVVAGLVLSWIYDVRPGSTVVLVAIAIYLVAIALSERELLSLSAH